ncbi:hypothetical protein BGW37DRAFT_541261 [Umbelopsis sp. PMI_123]|nr:hypothetical protein BGW37DRAFT_541261 [Umbelopsis sp. PMI_123]
MPSREKQIPQSLSDISHKESSQKYSASTMQIAMGLLSIAVFPASWVLVYYMMDHKEWCFADFCVKSMGSRKLPVRNTLAVYYCFLVLTAFIALASQRIRMVKRILSMNHMSTSSATLGEITWFVVALLVTNIGVPAMIWKAYWNMWDMMVIGMDGSTDIGDGFFTTYWPWIRIVYETLILTTGDSLAINFGLSLLVNCYSSSRNDAFLLNGRYASLQITFTVIYDPETWGDSNYLFINGMISFLILGVVVLTSLNFVRRRFYNSFYFIHLLVFVAIVFAYLHASMSIFYLISGLCLYGIDGIIRLSSRFVKYPFVSVNHEDCGYFSIKVQRNKAEVQAGQFMRIAIPDISNIEFHPFTVAESTEESITFVFAPNRQPGSHSEWTNRLAQALQTNPQRMVCMQGPYGKTMELVRDASDMDAIVFYVGGTGITAALTGINSLLDDMSICSHIGASTASKKVFLFWAAGVEHIESFSLIRDLVANAAKISSSLLVHLFDTTDPGYDKAICNEKLVTHGRPHMPALLNRHITPLFDNIKSLRFGVFICGPEGFVKDGMRGVNVFKQSNKNVHIAVEVESFCL